MKKVTKLLAFLCVLVMVLGTTAFAAEYSQNAEGTERPEASEELEELKEWGETEELGGSVVRSLRELTPEEWMQGVAYGFAYYEVLPEKQLEYPVTSAAQEDIDSALAFLESEKRGFELYKIFDIIPEVEGVQKRDTQVQKLNLSVEGLDGAYDYRALHLESGKWIDRAININLSQAGENASIELGNIPNFSPFAIVRKASDITAAVKVSVDGQERAMTDVEWVKSKVGTPVVFEITAASGTFTGLTDGGAPLPGTFVVKPEGSKMTVTWTPDSEATTYVSFVYVLDGVPKVLGNRWALQGLPRNDTPAERVDFTYLREDLFGEIGDDVRHIESYMETPGGHIGAKAVSGTWGGTYTAEGLPRGVTMDPESGELKGKFEEVGSGSFTVTYTTPGDQYQTKSKAFNYEVFAPGTLPRSLKLEPSDEDRTLKGTVGVPLSVKVVLSGGKTGGIFGIGETDSLPRGLTIDSGTGVISGTPQQAGQERFEINYQPLGSKIVIDFYAHSDIKTGASGSGSGSSRVYNNMTVSETQNKREILAEGLEVEEAYENDKKTKVNTKNIYVGPATEANIQSAETAARKVGKVFKAAEIVLKDADGKIRETTYLKTKVPEVKAGEKLTVIYKSNNSTNEVWKACQAEVGNGYVLVKASEVNGTFAFVRSGSPQTGDNTNFAVIIVAMAGALSLMVLVFTGKIKKITENNERSDF